MARGIAVVGMGHERGFDHFVYDLPQCWHAAQEGERDERGTERAEGGKTRHGGRMPAGAVLVKLLL